LPAPYLIRIARLGCQPPDGLPLRAQILGDVVVDEFGEVLLALDREAGAAAARGIVALNSDIVFADLLSKPTLSTSLFRSERGSSPCVEFGLGQSQRFGGERIESSSPRAQQGRGPRRCR
jgi:hypothetical protein